MLCRRGEDLRSVVGSWEMGGFSASEVHQWGGGRL